MCRSDSGAAARSRTVTKRKAAQIAGNMTSLADAADLEPYVDELLPRVRELLFDPVHGRGCASA